MRVNLKEKMLLLCFCLSALCSYAELPHPIVLKDKTQLSFIGAAAHQHFSKTIYIGALYSADTSYAFQTEKSMLLELRVVTEQVSGQTLATLWKESININIDQVTTKKQANEIAEFVNVLKNGVASRQFKWIRGDHIQLLYRPRIGTQVSFNTKVLTTFADATLFPLLLNAWIGNVPPSSSFKDNIVGKNNTENKKPGALFSQYNALFPQPIRIATIKLMRKNTLTAKENSHTVATSTVTTNHVISTEAAENMRLAIEEEIRQEEKVRQEEKRKLAAKKEREKQATLAAQKRSLIQRYHKQFGQFIRAFQKYPRIALKKGITGTVIFTIQVQPNGDFTFIVQTSSGSTILDKAAINTLRTAQEALTEKKHLLILPKDIASPTVAFLLPMTYVLPKKK